MAGFKTIRIGMMMEAAGGFEPPNRGFADRSLNHLGMPPLDNKAAKRSKLGYPNYYSARSAGLNLSARNKMERETGVEPATSTLARLHSTTELLPHFKNCQTQLFF